MEEISLAKRVDQMRRRREQVVQTLGYLKKERAEIERNTDWLDQAAYASRVRLLDRLRGWYIAEIKQIDNALERARFTSRLPGIDREVRTDK